MKIEETESTITFREVPAECLDSFKNMGGKLLFIEGIANDGLFNATFTAPSFEAFDVEEYKKDREENDDVKLVFTLYYLKKT